MSEETVGNASECSVKHIMNDSQSLKGNSDTGNRVLAALKKALPSAIVCSDELFICGEVNEIEQFEDALTIVKNGIQRDKELIDTIHKATRHANLPPKPISGYLLNFTEQEEIEEILASETKESEFQTIRLLASKILATKVVQEGLGLTDEQCLKCGMPLLQNDENRIDCYVCPDLATLNVMDQSKEVKVSDENSIGSDSEIVETSSCNSVKLNDHTPASVPLLEPKSRSSFQERDLRIPQDETAVIKQAESVEKEEVGKEDDPFLKTEGASDQVKLSSERIEENKIAKNQVDCSPGPGKLEEEEHSEVKKENITTVPSSITTTDSNLTECDRFLHLNPSVEELDSVECARKDENICGDLVSSSYIDSQDIYDGTKINVNVEEEEEDSEIDEIELLRNACSHD